MLNILCTTEEFITEPLPGNLRFIFNPQRRKLTEEEVGALLRTHAPAGMIAGIELLTRTVLENARSLKVISRCGTGLDSVDLEAASELGIAVFNTPDAPTVAVAELALTFMLSMARKVNAMDRAIRAGQWTRPMGTLLTGRTVGIVGCGRIGTHVAKLLTPFGCELTGYDPFLSCHDLIRLGPLDALLKASDFITLHIPLTATTRHILGRRQFEQMKPGVFLINVARGGLVDEEALLGAIQSGKIAGAALDCFEQEPYTGALSALDNVLMTPHIGSNARETKMLMERQALDNLVKGLKACNLL